jgi:hypothetical protein
LVCEVRAKQTIQERGYIGTRYAQLKEGGHMNEDLIIAEVARRMGVKEERVRMRDRAPEVAAARHAVFWALNRSGLNPAQIARLLGMNHSSIVHGLKRVELHPEWKAIVQPAVDLSGVGGQRAALHSWLNRELRDLSERDRRAVRAYVVCSLLGWERQDNGWCSYGLLLVRQHPQLRAKVQTALERADLGPHAGQMEIQSHHYGYQRI